IAFDLDPMRVQRAREKGLNVFYGDVGDVGVLASGGIGKASCMVITAQDPHSIEKILEAVHSCYSNLRVYARARFLSEADEFVKAGATLALPDTLESSLRLGHIVLEAAGTDPQQADRITEFFRENGYHALRAAPGERFGPFRGK
ncbi:MAG: NAD-binding protein, partial [Puniceicoccales bacterium]